MVLMLSMVCTGCSLERSGRGWRVGQDSPGAGYGGVDAGSPWSFAPDDDGTVAPTAPTLPPPRHTADAMVGLPGDLPGLPSSEPDAGAVDADVGGDSGTCGEMDCSASPLLESLEASYSENQPIKLRYANLPPGDKHWIGTYERGAGVRDHVAWDFTDGSPGGVVELPALPAGRYSARLFLDNSYEVELEVFFEVDGCPDDPAKLKPGTCGCGRAEGSCQQNTCGGLDGYASHSVKGWTVCMADDLTSSRELSADVLGALEEDLEYIVRVLPDDAVEFLRRVRIWFERDHERFEGGVYHPSERWLQEHGYPTQWARGIQFGNARNYLGWTREQPAMVLHELAHAWHHQRLGYDDEDIEDAYKEAMKDHLYDSVEHVNGGRREAYAKRNKQEYFAELSEAYFWRNDFYPFDERDLHDHDHEGHKVVESSWFDP